MRFLIGTRVAADRSMANALAVTARMSCPLCGRTVSPTPDSTWIVAWYSCPRCGHDWSARIRNGRPDQALAEDGIMYRLLHRGRQ